MRALSFFPSLVALLLFGLPAFAQQDPGTKRVRISIRDIGGTQPDLLARAFAPVMWLSEDEKYVPTKLPIECDEDESVEPVPDSPYQYTKKSDPEPIDPQKPRPTVYYYVHDRSKAEAAPWRELWVRYWFYYENEHGYHAHEHDLERVDLRIRSDYDPSTGDVTEFWVDCMVGAAHGSRWFENQLIGAEIPYPPMVFVEEGKHATCPDRTGDGKYTPGDDINRSVSNAWGVRDILGSGFLGVSPTYRAHMTKTRKDRHVLAADFAIARQELENRFHRKIIDADTYDLIAAEALEEEDVCGRPDGVVNVMRRRILGKRGPFQRVLVPILTDPEVPLPVTNPLNVIDFVGVRWDQSRTLISAQIPLGTILARAGLQLPGEFNAVAHCDRASGTNYCGANLMYTPNIAYWLTSYAMVGLDPESVGVEDREALELGLRLRVPTLKHRWVHRAGFVSIVLDQLVPELLGARLGLRVTDFDAIRNERLVLEIGGGLW
jgi:hypothetical protein